MPIEINSCLFFRLFGIGVPASVIIVSLVLATCASTYIYYKRNRQHVLLPWILACLFLMLYTTVLGRDMSDGNHLQLIPLWSIEAIRGGYIETLYEKIYNVIFFVPYGVLLVAYSLLKGKAYPQPLHEGKAYPQPLPKGKGVLFWRIVLIGFLTSVGIELLQLVTRTGTCETDDVICNTVGCALGAGIAIGCLKGFKKIMEKKMT